MAYRLNRKTLMFDAGSIMIESGAGFGTVLGQTCAQLEAEGKVLKLDEADAETVPQNIKDCDFVLDWSNALRYRYIAVDVEDGGTAGKYFITFHEGSRSKFILAAIIGLIFCSRPDRRGIRKVEAIKNTFR